MVKHCAMKGHKERWSLSATHPIIAAVVSIALRLLHPGENALRLCSKCVGKRKQKTRLWEHGQAREESRKFLRQIGTSHNAEVLSTNAQSIKHTTEEFMICRNFALL
jgi:hypothetical protein